MKKENKNLKDKNNFSFNQKNNNFNKNHKNLKTNQNQNSKKSNKKFQKILLLDELEKIENDNTKTSQVINNENDVNISKSIKINKDNKNVSQAINNKDDVNISKSIKNNKDKRNISQAINNKDDVNISKSIKINKDNKNISSILKKEILQDEKRNINNQSKSKEKTTEDSITAEEFNQDLTTLKNLILEKKKLKAILDKNDLENKIKKQHTIKFKEIKETTDEHGNPILENKFIFPKIEEKGFRYEKTNIEKLNHRTNDLVRGKIHREIQEDEDNNTTVKSLHFFEKRTETNLISYIRNKNFRNIKKYQKLDKKIENITKKQNYNNLKTQLNTSNKKELKNALKKTNQKNAYKKMMVKEIRKATAKKYIEKTVTSIISTTSNPLNVLLSLKGILIGFVIFLIIFVISFVSMFFTQESKGNIYEIQKAELYYREMEAKIEFEHGKRINHNPIDLSSFLTVVFGEFVFDDYMKNALEKLITVQYEENKLLSTIIKENLAEEQYTYFLELHQNKGGFIKYGSPFKEEYESRITSYIGYRINPTSSTPKLQLHKGLDIGMNGGTPILAISNGTVIRANYSNSFGNIVEIRHDDGYVSKYAHQQRLNVKKGQKVKQGDVIGFVGTTGDSTGNHLHLELYDENGEFMNPIFFIARNNQGSEENENRKT